MKIVIIEDEPITARELKFILRKLEPDVIILEEIEMKVIDNKGKIVWAKTIPVTVTGGTKYGELLSAANIFSPLTEGYSFVSAELVSKDNKAIALGSDELFAVNYLEV